MQNNFQINIGYEKCEKQLDGKIHKPVTLDISKFPALFIDYNHAIEEDTDMDEITSKIMSKCMSFYPQDRVKCVVIDGCGVAYNSMMKPGTYNRKRRDIMMKRLDTYVSKIYAEYLQNPDNFIPHTKYIILVCRIGGLEKELISLMSKIGQIGVYLIMADDASQFENFPRLFTNLYGKLTYTKFDSLDNKSEIKYDIDQQHQTELELPIPEYVYVLERLQLYYSKSPIIYSNDFYQKFYTAIQAHEDWSGFWNQKSNLKLARL